MLDFTGTTLDRFKIVSRIGEDRWGVLFKAYDPKFDRTVTMQFLRAQVTQQEGMGEYITQVARTILRWRHPGIAKVLDMGQAESLTYLVWEFLSGANLHTLLADLRSQSKWITLTEALQLTRQVCLALDYAHQRGLLHGDLQPENISFQPDAADDLPYQPVLTNLGFITPDAPQRASATAYEPPEQARGEKLDRRSDIYAAGILLYELATGKAPTIATGLAANEGPGRFLPPCIVRPDLPSAIEKVILTATAQQPDKRYAEASAMAQALANVLPEANQVTTPPADYSEAGSLLLAYRRSASTPVQAAFAPQGSAPNVVDISQDQIHILLPDKSTRSVAMKPEGLTLGRSPDNDIVLDHSGISRHHSRIDFDGAHYQVRDLKSMNGTYIDGEKLNPDEPCSWQPGQDMVIGEIWLRLERASQEQTTTAMPAEQPARETALPQTRPIPIVQATTPAVVTPAPAPQAARAAGAETLPRPDGGSVDASQVSFSPGNGWVGVYTDTPNLAITPGKGTSASLLLFNRGPKADTFRINFAGIPPEWILNRPQAVPMQAGEQREVQLTFQPPRSPQGRAGRHQMTVQVASQNDPGQVVETRMALTVAAFSQFSSELRPKRLQPGQVGEVIIHNQGNLPETFTLTLDDKQGELAFDPPQAKITIPPGNSGIIEFRVSLAQQRLMGSEMLHSFGAIVSTPTKQYQPHTGELASHGIIPPWAPIALGVLCVVLACISILFYNQLRAPERDARNTQAAQETALVQIVQGTNVANTATAQSYVNANQATIQAVTATANWMQGDDDLDSLPNGQEILFTTRPDRPDTDEDGLKDGEEIKTYNTNPLLADTDGDGLKDGEEVRRAIDPLKKDTDGDGIMDAVDPDPGRRPTSTVTPENTVTPKPSHTPTETEVPIADLFISLDNGVPASIPGSNTAYRIIVTNRGPSSVTNVQVVDNFPGLLGNISWTCNASGGSRCHKANGNGNINALVDLANNGSATFVATGTINPAASGLLINTASAAVPAGVIEPNNADNLAMDTDTLNPKVSFTLAVTDNRDNITPGEDTTYTIQAINAGPSSISGVSITDILPDALTNINWSCNASTGSTCTPNGAPGGNVDVTASLGPGGKATIIIEATVKAGATGTINNTAYLSSPLDPANNNKTATDNTVITLSTDIEIDVSTPPTATVSSPVTYTIRITNTGPSNATGLSVITMLPANVTFIAVTPGSTGCTASSSVVTCNLGNLAVGGVIEIQITVIMPATPGNVATQIEAAAAESDPNQANNRETSEVLVE